MENITAAGNTEIPAYLSLLCEGCQVERKLLDNNEELWIAEQGGLRLSGTSLLEVLGLYYMREKRGNNWKAHDSEIEDFMKQFYPDDIR